MPILNPDQGNTSGGGLSPADQLKLDGAQQRADKNQANGYAGLDANSKIDVNQIPTSVSQQVTSVFDANDTTHSPNAAAIATQLATKADSSAVPDMSAISDGEVPLYDAATGTFKPSGVKLITDGVGVTSLLMPDNTEIESQSLSVGDVVRIGEAGSFVCFRNQVDGKQYFALDVLIDKINGTATPHYMQVGAESTIIVQPIFNTILTGVTLSSTFTTTQMQLISGVTFKVASQMTNVRMQVVDVATGKVLKSWPSKNEWYENTGETWNAGDVTIDLSTNQVQFPSAGIQVRLDIKADNISLRGSLGVFPYLAIKTQNGTFVNLASQPWAQTQIANAIADTLALAYDPLDTTHALTGAVAESRILSAISQAQSTRRQVGTWNASTNTPTLTDPPTTINGNTLVVGDYVEVSTAGTRFGITWAIGDVAKVVQTTSGALGWYKDPVQNDKFDSKNVWASQAAGSDANSGSLYRPKQTLTGAIGVVAQPGSIHLTPGVYAAGALTISKTNVNIFGEGVNANNSVEISGQITTGAGRIRLRNVNFTQGSGTAFTWNDTTGGHNIQDISTTTGQTGPVFTGTANANGVLSTISNGDLGGSLAPNNIVLANRASGTAGLYLVNLANVRISVGTGWIVYVNACPDIQITGNTAGVFFVDSINVNAVFTQQSQLTALLADNNVSTDGYYICDFASPSVGARNDLLLKKSIQGVATNVQVNRPYNQCTASISVFTGSVFEAYSKKAGGWVAISSGGAGVSSVTMAQRTAITTAQTVYNTATKIVESYDGTSWKPLSPVTITALDPLTITTAGIYVIQNGTLPSVVQNGVINQGDIFYFDGTLYWALYTWVNSPSSIYISGNSVSQTLLKSSTVNNWYYAPTVRVVDTGIVYSTKVNSAMGTPATPYQMVPSDTVVQIDNSSAVGVRLPSIVSIASTALTRRFTITCPRPVSSQTVALFTNGSDTIVGGPMGHPNGVTQMYLTPGDSITFDAYVDATLGNVWVVHSYTAYDAGATYYYGTLSSSTILTSWGGYWHVNAASGNMTITLPLSSFGKAGAYVKLIRTDTNSSATVTLAVPSGYTLNGTTTGVLSVGCSVVVSTHTSGNTALRAEYSGTVPVRCVMTTSGASVTISSIWGFQGCPFSTVQTAFSKYDPYGMHNQATPTRVYAPVGGMYKLSGSYRLDNTSGAQLCGIRYFKNGIATNNEFFHPVVGGVIMQADFTANIVLAAGDYVEMGIYADTFKTLGVWTGNFSVELMG
jgi:hypothetical protein